ncbi:MAG: hypothetical protein CO108_08050 [Deltaproteobacteria bacterium CG_4_9_14_3_um_filter_63_12]|nr:MAG: hypothetical protein CO108_08050 [Deltaproteobacteria bacterium CG_4_9_14_3_um_filter_63_12]
MMTSGTGFVPHHLTIGPKALDGNGDVGRVVFLPGCDARARRIAGYFENVKEYLSPRQLNVFTGTLLDGSRRVDVATVSTGMGSGSAEIVVSELIMLGAKRLIRVGTSGSLQPARIRVGDCVIASAAVRDEHATEAYGPREVPAISHPHWVEALSEAAHNLQIAKHCFVGSVHSKDSLYGRELGIGPRAKQHEDYMKTLEILGILATEMETSTLFMLAAAHAPIIASLADSRKDLRGIKAGSVLAVVGDDTPFATPEQVYAAEGRAIELAVEAAKLLMRFEG